LFAHIKEQLNCPLPSIQTSVCGLSTLATTCPPAAALSVFSCQLSIEVSLVLLLLRQLRPPRLHQDLLLLRSRLLRQTSLRLAMKAFPRLSNNKRYNCNNNNNKRYKCSNSDINSYSNKRVEPTVLNCPWAALRTNLHLKA
jgi:hypothetical protein